MTKKTWFKAALDAAMLIVLLLMFRKQVISMDFHEIGGLAVIGAFVLHVLLNGRWVLRVGAKLFSRGVKASTRIGWVVDALLLVSFAAIGITGVMISKTLFHVQGGGMQAKQFHYFFSALAIVLMGVHLGLHLGFIGRVLRRVLPLSPRVARALAVLCTAALVLYGGYSLATTSFTSWLTGPFRTMQRMEHAQPEHLGEGEHAPGSDREAEHGKQDGSGRMQGKGKMDGSGGGKNRPLWASATDLASTGDLPGFDRGHGGFDMEHGMQRSVSFTDVVRVLVQYLSEMSVFAALTALILKLTRRKPKQARA